MTKFINFVLALAGLFAIAVGLYFLFKGDATSAVSGVGCGVVLILLATVDRFEVIKGIGIEAKTRSLQRELDHADQILSQIREMTVAFAPSLLSVYSNAGRWMGPQPPTLVYSLARATDKLMTAAGQGRIEVRRSLIPWSKISAMDLAYALVESVSEDAQKEASRLQGELNNYPRPIVVDDLKYRDIRDRLAKASSWASLWSLFEDCDAAQCAFELSRLAREVPNFIGESVASKFKSDVEFWRPQLEYLAQYDDFKDPEAWLEQLTKFHERNKNKLKVS